MAKLFESSDYVVEMVKEEFANCGLESYGLNLKVISTVKSRDIITANKASATTEFVSKQEGMIIVTVYEKAFERLDTEDKQRLFVEAALSAVSFDSEKDKINIEKNQAVILHNMRHKYNNEVLDILELNQIIIQQIDEEEKAEKEAKKQERLEKRLAKQKI